MKIGLLRNPVRQEGTLSEKLTDLGENSGNLVFWEALDKLFAPTKLSYGDIEGIRSCEKIIITDLIWIRENSDFSYLEKIIDLNFIPFIPISIGLQSTTYDIHYHLQENTVRLLHKLEERALLGVRGDYTAEILNKYGIKNISVIGCPSMYYWKDKNFCVSGIKELGKVSCNFRSFWGKLSVPEKHFLSFCARQNMQFIEQTKWKFLPEQVNDLSYYSYINHWLLRQTIFPMSIEEWCNALKNISFSIGGRFHGNVMALWNGIKALFLTVDSRTAELTDYFRLPAISMAKFRWDRPIEYYFAQADYTEFNRIYPLRYKEFHKFARKNGLSIVDDEVLSDVTRDSKPACAVVPNRNKIFLKSVLCLKNLLAYEFDVSDDLAIFFANKKSFTVEYECDMENIPLSVAVIPFLSLVLPVSWLTDAELEVEEIDQDFFESIDEMKRGYATMYPDLCFKGRIKTKRIIRNTVDYSLRRVMCLHSGGVDATSTLLSNLCYRPELFTIWGADIFFEQENAWEKSLQKIKQTSKILGLAHTTVKTSFRYILNEKELTKKFAEGVNENWWHGFEHGIALLGHAAPYAYLKNIMDIKIAATYDATDQKRQTCASDSTIDERMRFCGCKVYHDGFEKTRQDKIRQILRFAERTGIRLPLRVCWEEITGENCCVCEKCGRTIFAIYAAGGDPREYGFDLTDSRKDKILKNIKEGKIYKNKFWNEVKELLYRKKEEFTDNELVRELIKDYKSGKSNFFETQLVLSKR